MVPKLFHEQDARSDNPHTNVCFKIKREDAPLDIVKADGGGGEAVTPAILNFDIRWK